MNKFLFSVLTPNGRVFKGMIEKAIVTTSNGEITVLKNHIPLIATTSKGRVVIYQEGNVMGYMASCGVLKISREEVMLLSEKIENLK